MANGFNILFWELPDWRLMHCDSVFFSDLSRASAGCPSPFCPLSFVTFFSISPSQSQLTSLISFLSSVLPSSSVFVFNLCPPVIFINRFHHATLLLKDLHCLQDEPDVSTLNSSINCQPAFKPHLLLTSFYPHSRQSVLFTSFRAHLLCPASFILVF